MRTHSVDRAPGRRSPPPRPCRPARAALLRRRSDRARAGEPQRRRRQAARHRAVLRVRLQPVRDRAAPAVEHPRRQRQHDRRGARLELVHQPHRRRADDRRAASRAASTPTPPPAPEKWTLLREKSAGTNPGFTARDANGQTWFLQFDSPEYPEGEHRRRRDRDEAVLGARLQPGRDVHHDASIRRASQIDPKATIKRPSGARTPFTRDDIDARARARGAQRRRHLPRVGRPPAAGKGPRAVPLRGHALRRSERPRAARAPPRAARAARLRRLDEPGRLEGRQHARHARRGERPHRS